ncbi:hypothetical protein [Streptococcus pluranimalium]|uniref:hypothetical protein n=1 Tax=Streptococcus pluranimalium TaxID=82348 RepID=UPI003F690247
MTVKALIEKLKEFDESKDVRLVVENVDLLEARDLVDVDKWNLVANIPSDRRGYIEIVLAENNLLEIRGEW